MPQFYPQNVQDNFQTHRFLCSFAKGPLTDVIVMATEPLEPKKVQFYYLTLLPTTKFAAPVSF